MCISCIFNHNQTFKTYSYFLALHGKNKQKKKIITQNKVKFNFNFSEQIMHTWWQKSNS